MAVLIQDIEIFSQIDESSRDQIEALFVSQTYQEEDEITRYGEPVDGLYLLERGQVEVSLPGFSGVLATLDEGTSFGELSLFSPDDVASATVTVSSDSAEILFCPRDSLNLALQLNEKLAAGFYRGSTLMVANRLKNTNQKISGEISKSIKMATGLIDEISSAGDLGITQGELESVGSVIVSGMTDIVKKLLVMKDADRPIEPSEIAILADKAKEIYYSDFQVFDRVNKKLKTMGQHLDNVNRILSNQDMMDVDEDMSLHDLS